MRQSAKSADESFHKNIACSIDGSSSKARSVVSSRAEKAATISAFGNSYRLPVVLSREEASRLIEGARTLKHQTVLSVAYGAGLRVSEVVALKVGDIDSQRMLLRIEKGKGQKDRYALLPPIMLERLRTWWRYARAEGKVLPGGCLAGIYFRASIRWIRCALGN